MLITAAAALVTHDLLAVWNMQTRLELDAVHMAARSGEYEPEAPVLMLRCFFYRPEGAATKQPRATPWEKSDGRPSLAL